MKRYMAVMGVVFILLVAGGAISSGLIDLSGLAIIQTADPNASAFEATPEQANQFFFWIVFVLVNVVGAGLTLALVFWLGSRSVAQARSMSTPAQEAAKTSAE